MQGFLAYLVFIFFPFSKPSPTWAMKIDCPMIVQFEECFMLAVVPFKLWLSIESWKFQQRLNAWFCLILNLHKPLHQFWNISPLQKGLILSITWLESLMLFYDSHSFCLLFLIFFLRISLGPRSMFGSSSGGSYLQQVSWWILPDQEKFK